VGWQCQGGPLAAATRCDRAAAKAQPEVYLAVVAEKRF